MRRVTMHCLHFASARIALHVASRQISVVSFPLRTRVIPPNKTPLADMSRCDIFPFQSDLYPVRPPICQKTFPIPAGHESTCDIHRVGGCFFPPLAQLFVNDTKDTLLVIIPFVVLESSLSPFLNIYMYSGNLGPPVLKRILY